MMTTAFLALAAAGQVSTYIRSGQDGSEAESIAVFTSTPDEVHVVKMREPCTSAAYVTARLDGDTGQVLSLAGGRLTRELGQEVQATLTRNGGGALVIDAGEGGPALAPVPVGERWVLYDFDFAEWIAHPPPEILRGEDFAADLPLFWIEDGVGFSNLGRLELIYGGSGEHRGQRFQYYRAGGSALGGDDGQFWFDAEGRLIDAVMPIPNHSEYTDLRLRRVDTAQGEEAWKALLARHWDGCE